MRDNPRSARVRERARLRQKDARSETGLFLLEGPQAIREAVSFRPELVTEAYVSEDAWVKHTDLVTALGDAGIPWELATDKVIDALADTRTPQGMVAVCRQFPVSLRALLGPEATSGLRLIAVLEDVRDPGNMGTIIRAADAAGADAVILTGRSVDLYNPKVVRSTTGSLFHLPIAVGAQLDEVTSLARGRGMQVLAADVAGEELTFTSGRLLAAATAWVFGNEAHGLSPEALACADRALRLPIFGSAESLNVATAASVLLYQSAFMQHAELPGRDTDLG
ncbi:MAG TPA: RNA methyltransferase [Pseudoclavibacter sp.]|nr:RNA methyltransferase [Pseudoclavibacter sp.]